MRKTPLAIALALSVQTLSMQGTAIAQEAQNEELEVITVTASRGTHQVMKPLASEIVLTRDDIQLAQVETITELLSRFAGIDVAQNGGRGQQASVFIRGAGSDQTLVLVNGVRINSATSGGANWSTISPELIERVEIIKGPRTAVWGSDAIGGVINIITRDMTPGKVMLNARYGVNDTQAYAAGTGFQHGEGSTSILMNYERSDGFDAIKSSEPDDDGYNNVGLTVNGGQKINDALNVSWMVRVSDQDSEFDGSFVNESESQNNEWALGANYNWQVDGVDNTTILTVGAMRDSTESFLNGVSRSLFETRRDQYSLVNTTQLSSAFSIALGGELYNEEIATGASAYPETERKVEGYFAHGLFAKDAFTAELAVRHDDVENVGSETTYNFSAGVFFSEYVQLKFLVGTGFKAPTFNDLYSPFGGNSELVSETSDSEEWVLSYAKDNLSVDFSWYQNDIENLIEWSPDANNNWQPRNIASAEIEGIDVTISYDSSIGRHDFNIGYLDAVDGNTGNRLVRRAKNQFGYQFSAELDQVDFQLSYEFKGPRYDQGRRLSRYALVDVSLAYDFSEDLTGQLKVNNLLGEKYETVFDYNALDVAVYAGISYQL